MTNLPEGLNEWVTFLSDAEIPVLKYTARELNRQQEDEDKLHARGIANVVINDPMMTIRLLRYMQDHKRKNQLQDIVQVEQAIMMMGMSTFFREIPASPLVEEVLHEKLAALTYLLKLIHRAHRAAHYAFDWALLLHDLHAEEIRIAALLHDLAEMLMWCFNPEKMLLIREMQTADKSLRSQNVQQDILGFKLIELQSALIENWQLPELLSKLMNDSDANEHRIKNVMLAINLARHSSNGWDDAALPDDYRDIAELLRMDASKVMHIVGAPVPKVEEIQPNSDSEVA